MQDYRSETVVGGHRRMECWGLRMGIEGPACHPAAGGGIPGEASDSGGPSQERGRGLVRGSDSQPQPSRAPSSHPRAPIAEHWVCRCVRAVRLLVLSEAWWSPALAGRLS